MPFGCAVRQRLEQRQIAPVIACVIGASFGTFLALAGPSGALADPDTVDTKITAASNEAVEPAIAKATKDAALEFAAIDGQEIEVDAVSKDTDAVDLSSLMRGSVSPRNQREEVRTAALHDMLHRSIIHDRISKHAEYTDMALRHTDKTFFSSNPVSFHQLPPALGDIDADNDGMQVGAWEEEDQPFDQLVAIVDLSEQRMRVYEHGVHKYTWKVSSGRRGYGTPTGEWRPYRMHTLWHSRKYNMAPMPHSVFYHGGFAVHATGAVGRLGRPASHGCVRLHPKHARKFFAMVRQAKKSGTIIRVVR